MNNKLHQLLEQRIVISDGGMGSLLQAAGLKAGELPEVWNILRGDVITGIGDTDTANLSALVTALMEAVPEEELTLNVLRPSGEGYTSIELTAVPDSATVMPE